MRTEELVDLLSQTPLPSRRSETVLAGALGLGTVVAFATMLVWLGLRPDLAAAILTTAFWVKLAYAVAVAACAFPLTVKVSHPTGSLNKGALAALVPALIMVALAAVQLASAPPSLRGKLIMGSSADVCPLRIFLLSLPILALLLAGVRRLAPTRLVQAGSAVGLLAGAAGTVVYALHCDESAMPFVAIWYTLGMSAVSLAGAAVGRFILRW